MELHRSGPSLLFSEQQASGKDLGREKEESA